jgi:F-type H+-transporting ATPase subunit gamma
MPSPRELRLRVRSIKNLAQVTRALETVSASYVRRAVQATLATRPYAEKAWQVLVHLANQPGGTNLHPLLADRPSVRKVLVVMVSGDRGLAGAYNVNILRHTLVSLRDYSMPVEFVAVGRKGRDLLLRRGKKVIADFSQLPNPPAFADVSAIGRLVVDDFLNGEYDEVYVAYTEFVNMITQRPVMRRLLPFSEEHQSQGQEKPAASSNHNNAVFTYEPDQEELLNEIVPRFTALQIYQAILSAQASEHAARMVAMRNATDSANELIDVLQLEYNKLRQQLITSEMLDISGGAEALSKGNG